jgi:hypothetical protein
MQERSPNTSNALSLWGVLNFYIKDSWGQTLFKLGFFLIIEKVLKSTKIKWGCIFLNDLYNTSYVHLKGGKSNCQNDS